MEKFWISSISELIQTISYLTQQLVSSTWNDVSFAQCRIFIRVILPPTDRIRSTVHFIITNPISRYTLLTKIELFKSFIEEIMYVDFEKRFARYKYSKLFVPQSTWKMTRRGLTSRCWAFRRLITTIKTIRREVAFPFHWYTFQSILASKHVIYESNHMLVIIFSYTNISIIETKYELKIYDNTYLRN